MLKINSLNVKKQGKILLNNLNLQICEFGLNAIIGPNGAGKTTFLKSFFQENVGEFILNDTNLSNLSTKQKSDIISYLPQFVSVLNISVKDTLSLARNSKSGAFLNENDKNKIAKIVNEFDLTDILDMKLMQLSGGIRQKVLIAATLLEEPKILLLDEPISHLDPKNQSAILDLLQKYTTKNEIYAFIVLHDISHALHFAKNIIMIKNANLLGCKDTSEINEKDLNELFDVYSQIFEIQNHKFVYYSHKHFTNLKNS